MLNSDNNFNHLHNIQLLESANDFNIYIEDISQSAEVWNKHKTNSDQVANLYKNSEEYQQYANRINLCSQFLEFELTNKADKYQLKLNAARFCRVRYCPICQW